MVKFSGMKKEIKISKKSDNCYELVLLDKHVLHLLGTVHISPESVKLVEEVVSAKKPDYVFVELDKERKKNLFQKMKEIDILKILKTRRTFFFLSYIFLSIMQKKFSEETGSPPGEEFKRAIESAGEVKAEVVLIDRAFDVTFKRLYRRLKFSEKIKLFYSFFSLEDKVKSEEINFKNLGKQDIVNGLVQDLGERFKTIKEVLIDERDVYMTKNILHNLMKKDEKTASVAVVGAGHLAGMLHYFKNSNELNHFNLANLNEIPPKSWFSKVIPYFLVLLIISVFILGFSFSDNENIVSHSFWIWVLANGIFCSLGALVALPHPLTVIGSFFAAPITSLNPTIGAGMVAGLIQTFVSPPKVKDFEGFSLKIADFKYWWRNRLTRILLVFIFSSIGSAIGTLVALPLIIKLI